MLGCGNSRLLPWQKGCGGGRGVCLLRAQAFWTIESPRDSWAVSEGGEQTITMLEQ
jgi:hypothetical protein